MRLPRRRSCHASMCADVMVVIVAAVLGPLLSFLRAVSAHTQCNLALLSGTLLLSERLSCCLASKKVTDMQKPGISVISALPLQATGWRVKLRALECFAKHCCGTSGSHAGSSGPCDHRTAQPFLHHAIDAAAAPSALTEMRRAALRAIAGIHTFAPRDVATAVRDHESGLSSAGSQGELLAAVSSVVPSIESDILALAHRPSNASATLRRGGSALEPAHSSAASGATPAAPHSPSGRTRQPLESIANSAATHRGASTDAELLRSSDHPATRQNGESAGGQSGATKLQLQALVEVIERQPKDCNRAIQQLTLAAQQLAPDIWQVRGLLHVLSYQTHSMAAASSVRVCLQRFCLLHRRKQHCCAVSHDAAALHLSYMKLCALAMQRLRDMPRTPSFSAQGSAAHVTSVLCRLLDCHYLDAYEDVCAFVRALTLHHPGTMAPSVGHVATALLQAYNTVPVETHAMLVRALEKALHDVATKLDVPALLQARCSSALLHVSPCCAEVALCSVKQAAIVQCLC